MSDDETEILHSHKEFKQLQEVIAKLKKQLKDAEIDSKRQGQTIDQLQQKLKYTVDLSSQLELQLNKKFDNLKLQYSSREKDSLTLINILQDLKSQKCIVEEQLSQERSVSQDKISELTLKLTQEQEQCQDFQKQHKASKIHGEQKQQEHTQLQQKYQQDVERLERQNTEYEDQLQKQQTTINLQIVKIDALNQKNLEKETHVKLQISDKTYKIDNLQQEKDKVQEELTQCKQSIVELQGEKESLLYKIQQQQIQFAKSQVENKQLAQAITQIEMNLHSVDKDKFSLKDKVTKLENDLLTSHNQTQILKERSNEYKAKLAEQLKIYENLSKDYEELVEKM